MLTLGNKSLPVEALVLPHPGPEEVLTDNITMKVFGAKLGKTLNDFLLNTVKSPSLQLYQKAYPIKVLFCNYPEKLHTYPCVRL